MQVLVSGTLLNNADIRQLSKRMGKALIPFLPEFLTIRPSLGGGINLVHGNCNYKNSSISDSASGYAWEADAGIAAEFNIKGPVIII